MPIPPARLRFLAIGNTRVDSFLQTGNAIATLIDRLFAENGFALRQINSVLAFGAGCGRIERHLHRYLEKASFVCTDYNKQYETWCAQHLRFATWMTNDLRPPLPFRDGSFGFVYAYSVFTHLPEELQELWIAELRRLLPPQGFFFMTTHGEAFARQRLADDHLRRFAADRLVVQRTELAGTNRCAAFQSPKSVESLVTDRFDIIDWRPGHGPAGSAEDAQATTSSLPQDVYLMRAA